MSTKVYVVKYGHFEGDDPIGVYTDRTMAEYVSKEHYDAEIFEIELDQHVNAYKSGYKLYTSLYGWRDIQSKNPQDKTCGKPSYPGEFEFIETPVLQTDPTWRDNLGREHGGGTWAYVWAVSEEEAFDKMSRVLEERLSTKEE